MVVLPELHPVLLALLTRPRAVLVPAPRLRGYRDPQRRLRRARQCEREDLRARQRVREGMPLVYLGVRTGALMRVWRRLALLSLVERLCVLQLMQRVCVEHGLVWEGRKGRLAVPVALGGHLLMEVGRGWGEGRGDGGRGDGEAFGGVGERGGGLGLVARFFEDRTREENLRMGTGCEGDRLARYARGTYEQRNGGRYKAPDAADHL